MHDRPARPTAFCWNQKYPRICGEKPSQKGCGSYPAGSPPRMRGKWYVEVIDVHVARITPAYARKSETAADHSTAGSGSPPHMQGKEMPKGLVHRAAGIIPAYAGKRTPCRNTSLRYWDHPRVCGEKPNRILWEHWKEGSPPRMRGKVSSIDEVFVSQGITPAYAGKSR